MSEQNLSSALVERESKQASSWLRWSRKLVLHKLEALSGGRLTIIDPMGVWTRGAATDLDVTIDDLQDFTSILVHIFFLLYFNYRSPYPLVIRKLKVYTLYKLRWSRIVDCVLISYCRI